MIFETKILLVLEDQPEFDDPILSKAKSDDDIAEERGEQWVDFAFDFDTIVGVRKVCSVKGKMLPTQCAIYLKSSEYSVIILEPYAKILRMYKDNVDKRDFIKDMIFPKE